MNQRQLLKLRFFNFRFVKKSSFSRLSCRFQAELNFDLLNKVLIVLTRVRDEQQQLERLVLIINVFHWRNAVRLDYMVELPAVLLPA